MEVTEKMLVTLNVHGGSDTMVMHIFDKTYRNVRGWKPFYLPLPDTNLILFVTGRSYDDGQATVHIANLATRKIQSFPAHDSHIGANIFPSPDPKRFERVRSFDGRHLITEARFLDNWFIYFLDLAKPEFEKEIAAHLYSPTKTTNVYEYAHGFIMQRGELVGKELHGYDLESLPR